MTIAERILGAWSLVSFESTLPDGRVVSAMGRDAGGSIFYTPDRHVSAILSRGDRVRAEPEKLYHKLDDADVAALARGFMAYSGPYELDEANAVLTHHFDLCIDPALIGTVQHRYVRFEGDMMELSARDNAGIAYPARLLWKRG